ncbi:MAG: nucleotidyltransferase family protein [Oscillatoria sp. SIO1A7]|nr:nucleotidyltransferase family protein [Oscillatoria sp. SIO1A7]
MKRVAVAILAAGRGSRLGGDSPKPLTLLGERTLLDRSLGAALDSGLDPVLLVVGYEAEKVAAVAPKQAIVVRNPDWQGGIASSLQAALRTLVGDRSITGICIGLADQPFIGAEAYRRLAAAGRQGAELAAATYGGARRNPVFLGRSLWFEAMKLEGDEGAKQLMRRYPVVEVPCDKTGNPIDIDTPEDLAREIANGA